MLVAARVLVGFGLACLAAALGTVAWTGRAGELATLLDAFAALIQRGWLLEPGWRWACWLLGGSLVVALSLGGVTFWLDRPRGPRGSLRAPASNQCNRAEWIAEIGQRILRNLSGSEPSVLVAFEDIVREA